MISKIKRGTRFKAGRRDISVMIRLNAEEDRGFCARANALGLSLSGWMRMILRRELGKKDKDEQG
jgi:hypothetical protein